MAKRKTAEQTTELSDSTETAYTETEFETDKKPYVSPVLTSEESKHTPDNPKYIYVGESRNGIAKGTLLDEIPEALNKPFLRELCIDVNKVSEFRKRAEVTTSREAFLLRKAKEL